MVNGINNEEKNTIIHATRNMGVLGGCRKRMWESQGSGEKWWVYLDGGDNHCNFASEI